MFPPKQISKLSTVRESTQSELKSSDTCNIQDENNHVERECLQGKSLKEFDVLISLKIIK